MNVHVIHIINIVFMGLNKIFIDYSFPTFEPVFWRSKIEPHGLRSKLQFLGEQGFLGN